MTNQAPSPEKQAARIRASIYQSIAAAGLLKGLKDRNKTKFAYCGESDADGFVDFEGSRYKIHFPSKQAYLLSL